MDPSALDPATTALVRGWLAAEGVDASYVAFVVRHATEPDATWRWCCGSNCDPCVERLGRVVDRARTALLGRTECPDCRPGLPKADPTA